MAALASLSIERTTGAVLPEELADVAAVQTPSIDQIPSSETALFQVRGVVLTEQHALINFKSYPLRAIYGASLRELPHSQSVVYGLILCGSILAAIMMSVSFMSAAITLGVSGAIALALRVAVPSNHVLRIVTADGETDALLSRDRAYLLGVFEALHNAIEQAQS